MARVGGETTLRAGRRRCGLSVSDEKALTDYQSSWLVFGNDDLVAPTVMQTIATTTVHTPQRDANNCHNRFALVRRDADGCDSDNAMALSDEGATNKEQKISQTVNATNELALFAYDRCCNGSRRSRRIHR